MKLNEEDLKNGTEIDIGAGHATPDGYGGLTIRKRGERYELYDLDQENIVLHDTDLETVVEKANQFTPLEFVYDPDHVPTW